MCFWKSITSIGFQLEVFKIIDNKVNYDNCEMYFEFFYKNIEFLGLSKPFRQLEKYASVSLELEQHMEDDHTDRGDCQRSIGNSNF